MNSRFAVATRCAICFTSHHLRPSVFTPPSFVAAISGGASIRAESHESGKYARQARDRHDRRPHPRNAVLTSAQGMTSWRPAEATGYPSSRCFAGFIRSADINSATFLEIAPPSTATDVRSNRASSRIEFSGGNRPANRGKRSTFLRQMSSLREAGRCCEIGFAESKMV